MTLFEIVREDGVVVFKEEVSRVELEKQFLLVQRVENLNQSYVVYTLDEDLNRVGRKKSYVPYESDTVTQMKLQKRGEEILDGLFEKLFDGKTIFTEIENISENS